MNHPPSSNQKYRPYFTSSEFREIIRCVKSSSTNLTLIRYLESFALKIDHGTISSQLTTRPTLSIEQKLGIAMAHTPTPVHTTHNIPSLHDRWVNDPASVTPGELSIIHQFRYENDLMTSEEESMYEASLMFPSASGK